MTPTITNADVLRHKAQQYLDNAGMTELELVAELTSISFDDDDVVEALDGCSVEPDGYCPHGYPSWLIFLGMI